MKAIKSLCLAYGKDFEGQTQPVIVDSRVRLVRNFGAFKFPDFLTSEERQAILNFTRERLHKNQLLNTELVPKNLSGDEQRVLKEWGIIDDQSFSSDWDEVGIFCSFQVRSMVTVNQGDHLQIQTVRNGLQLKEARKQCNVIDDFLDDGHYAFHERLGYLTARPTDLGTGLRVSLQLHLPGFVVTGQMEYLVRALQQIGIMVCELGGGAAQQNHYFQISNQYTLGIEEKEEVKRLGQVAETIRDQEQEIRRSWLEKNRHQLLDKIGRIYGVLSSGYLLGEEESREMLSWMRLAADLGVLDERYRSGIDRLTIESRPGNLCVLQEQALTPEEQNGIRAERIRHFFREIPEPNFFL